MSVEVFLQGQMDSVMLNEPFQATVTNMNAAIATNKFLFIGNDMDGKPVAIAIPKLTHMIDHGFE